jgi:hypothetical protein
MFTASLDHHPLLSMQAADVSTAMAERRAPMSNIMTIYKQRTITRHRMGESKSILWDLGISAVVGGVLGGIGSANIGKKDLVFGGIAGAASITLPFLAGTRDKIQHGAGTAFGIGVYRQIEAMKSSTTTTTHGAERVTSYGEDPIARAAAKL